MRYIKLFKESINPLIEPDMDLIKKYLGDLKDIFSDVEDELGITFGVEFYKWSKEESGYQFYDIIKEDGKIRKQFDTTFYAPFGYFVVSYYGKSDVRSENRSKNFKPCINRAENNFVHEVSTKITSDGYGDDEYYSVTFRLEEPLI